MLYFKRERAQNTQHAKNKNSLAWYFILNYDVCALF